MSLRATATRASVLNPPDQTQAETGPSRVRVCVCVCAQVMLGGGVAGAFYLELICRTGTVLWMFALTAVYIPPPLLSAYLPSVVSEFLWMLQTNQGT